MAVRENVEKFAEIGKASTEKDKETLAAADILEKGEFKKEKLTAMLRVYHL